MICFELLNFQIFLSSKTDIDFGLLNHMIDEMYDCFEAYNDKEALVFAIDALSIFKKIHNGFDLNISIYMFRIAELLHLLEDDQIKDKDSFRDETLTLCSLTVGIQCQHWSFFKLFLKLSKIQF